MTNIISEWFRDHEERIALAKQKLRAMHLLT